MTASAAMTRRSETDADATFRFALFCDSRPPSERLPGVAPLLAEQLMRHQFAGQTMTYRALYPAARCDIIEADGTPIGRVVVDTTDDAITLVDIALLAPWRGRGIGTALLREILAGADRPVRLSVQRSNGDAMRLYARLGFVMVEATDTEVRMAWDPHPPSAHGERYPDRLRLPLAFDAAALAADVDGLSATSWIAHFITQNYDGDWSVIPLRGKAGATHPVMMIFSDSTCHDYADTPFLDACPAIRAALARFACPLEAVRLMRLGPGASVKEHVDPDLDVAQGAVRFHIPIATNPHVRFVLNGRRVVMEPGSVWYLRLSDPHSVANDGATERVHLVVDALVNPWVEALFAAARAAAPATAFAAGMAEAAP